MGEEGHEELTPAPAPVPARDPRREREGGTMAFYIEKLLRGLQRLDKVRYSAAHRATGLRSDGAREWNEPECVWGRGGHRPKRGKVDTIRVVPEEYAADLAAIDEERKRLRAELAELDRREREVVEVAWRRSRPVTVDEAKAETEAALAARRSAAEQAQN
jgi:hypothetical protein